MFGGKLKSDCGCGESEREQGDARGVDALQVLGAGFPVLGPTLGGGLSGSGIGSGFGRVGGGNDAPVLWAEGAIFSYPQVRVDYHFDYSTPQRIFERGPNMLGAGLLRELGGLE